MRPKKDTLKRITLLALLCLICGGWIYKKATRAGELEITTLVTPEEGGPDGVITFRLINGATAPSDINISYSVNVSTPNPSTNGVDYTTLSGTIVLNAGDNEALLQVHVNDDLLIEGNEDIQILLTAATDQGGVSYLGANRSHTATLIDNDNRLSITKVADGRELGNGNAADGSYSIRLPGTLTFNEDILVKYTIDGGSTAIGGADYSTTNITGEIVLPANTNSVILPIHVLDDQIVEGNEMLQVTVQNQHHPTSSNIVFTSDPMQATAVVNIEDDDDKVPLGVQATTDGREPGGTGNDGNFRIGWPSGIYANGQVIITYTITGTAVNGTDYNTITLSKTIPTGASYVDIPVVVKDNNIVDGNRTVILTITRILPGAGVPPLVTGTPTGTVRIADNDILSSLQWKSASFTGTSVKAGEKITYTIHVRNTGNVDLPNVTISDLMPANTVYYSAQDGVRPDASNRLVWPVGLVPAGAPDVTRTFTVEVANDLTGVTSITNTGDVNNGDGTGDHPTTPPDPLNPNQPHPNPNPNDPSTDVPVDDGGKKSISWKSATYTGTGENGKVKPGDEIIYTVHVRNTGHVKLTGVVINDMIPAYTRLKDAEGNIPEVGGKLTWPVGDINVGAPDVTRTFTVTVISDLTGAVSITNTAGVDNGDGSGEHPTTPPDPLHPDQPHPNPDPNDPSTDVPVDNAKRSVSWKSADYTGTGANGMVKAGDIITYTIHVRNTGNVRLENIIITDTVPAYTEFRDADENKSPDPNGKLEWTITAINPGDAAVTRQFRVTVASDLTDAGYITNTGYVDGKPTSPPDPANDDQPHPNPDPNDPSTEVPVDNGKLSVNWKSAAYTGTGPNGGVTSGDEIVYTIHVRNTGSIKLTNVTITDTIPEYTSFVSADAGVKRTGDILQWTINEIAVGAADEVRSFTVKVIDDLTGAVNITNTAGVDNGNGKGNQPTTSSTPNDPNNPSANPPGGPSTNVAVDKLISWETWKSVVTAGGKEKVKPNEELTYTIHVRNTGNAAVENITVTDPVPLNTTYVSSNESGQYTEGTNTVTWTVSRIGVGEVKEIEMKVRSVDNLDSIPVIVNTATVSSGTDTKPTAGCDPALPGCNGQPGTTIETTPGDGLLVFANAMSPNGDGKNDFFVIKGLEKYPPATLYVFNRWGNMVYQSKAYNNDWDGNGLSEGTYYYKLEIEGINGMTKYTGWIVLKRK